MEDIQNNNSTKDMNISAAIEALLFVHGEPMKVSRLVTMLGVSIEEVNTGLASLSESLNSSGRGLSLMVSDGKAMLVTKPELGELVKTLTSEELDSELTPASLETMSLIAYLGPVSRAEIEFIRGVNSSFILRNLMVRGLVSKDADKERSGNFVYRPTFDFLRHVGAGNQEELPEFAKYRDLIRNISKQNENIT